MKEKLKKNLRWVFTVCLPLLLLFCHSNKENSKKFDFPCFTIILPGSARIINEKAFESDYVKSIVLDNDTISISLGKNTDNLYREVSVYSKKLENDPDVRDFDAYFSRTPQVDQMLCEHLPQYYMRDTISKHIARVVLQKRSKRGITGIHFKNLKNCKFQQLTFFAEGLSLEKSRNMYEIFKTIQFK